MEAVIEKSKKKKKKNSEATVNIVRNVDVNIRDTSENEENQTTNETLNVTDNNQETPINNINSSEVRNPEEIAQDTDYHNTGDIDHNEENQMTNEHSDGTDNYKLASIQLELNDKEPSISSRNYSVERNSEIVQEVASPHISGLTDTFKENEGRTACGDLLVGASANVSANENSKSITEILNLEKYLNMNKTILKTIENISSIPAQVNSLHKNVKNENIEPKDCMKPYTEQQLIALYHNSELDTLETFNTSYVEAELKGIPVKQHSLYDLLANYLKVREKITGNRLEIDQLRKEYKELQKNLWSLETASVTGRAECQDGQIVSASHSYNRSIFHRNVFQNIVRILGNIQKLLYENNTLYSYSAEDLKLQIQLYIQNVIVNVITVSNISVKGPVSLLMQSEPNHLKPYISEVRLCISVLFTFQRKLIRDSQFLNETRDWLAQLVAVLLRIATYQDHLFLINHILRCPAGVGNWAASFIQVPLALESETQPFANNQINHLLAIFSVILHPIKEREKFLKDISQNQNEVTDAVWVLVDSDGEEDDENAGISLKENDLVALFNQLPLDDLFRCLLLVQRKDNQDCYNVNFCNEHHLLRFFAFSTVLLRLVYSGLQTYNQPRYNQFSKRLSRFIRHVVQYATDQFEQYLKAGRSTDKAMMKRLQCEYDAFFLRAIYSLYSSQRLGAWQFLAVVPYNLVTTRTLWKIFYFLHVSDFQSDQILNPLIYDSYPSKLWEKEAREQFEEKLEKLEDAEIYYLLNTFANMALCRTNVDLDFIHSATMDLLQIGFISKTTQEICSKSARILLTHITSKYPHLLSDILKQVKDNIENIGNLALYLYEEIPLSIWVLSDDDLDNIAGLLLHHSINDVQTKLARMILSRLNWDLLHYEKHCDAAILVVKAVDQEPGYLQWGWQTILRLKLHISDKHFKEMGRVQDMEMFDILSKGIRENNPLAGFVTILMTTWGHLVPLICNKGLNQIVMLQSHQKHEAVLFALYQIMPLFSSSQECIINCDKFQEILLNLINADRGYISYAKSFIMTQNATILQQFGNMIETQIINYTYYNLNSPRLLVRLWMNSLVSVQNWNKDNGILFLLDVVVKTAFFHPDSLEVVHENLKDLYQCGTPQDSGSIISIFKWVSSGNNSANSLLSTSLAQYPWLAYIFLEVEHQEREIRSGLWREILIQLSKQTGKINVDNAIKKAASIVKVNPFSSGWLCIYRWAQQSLDVPLDHPLLPLLWQKFFTLYLTRIPCASTADKVCVGERFFEGIVNFTFLKKIKRRLQETIELYRQKVEDKENENNERKMFYKSCLKIFQAFSLWLEEPRLQEGNILLSELPAQYEPRLLSLIIEVNNIAPWYEYLDYEQIKEKQQACIKMWKVANFREKSNVNQPLLNPGSGVESDDPIERILRRLGSYDSPKSPPDISIKQSIVPQLDFSNKEKMFKQLEPSFKILKQFTNNHIMKISEHKALDCSYQELVPQLYRSVLNKVKKKVPCKGKNQTVHCSGAAIIVLEMQEARVNERVELQIQTNREAYESLVEKSLQLAGFNLYLSSVTLQQCVRILQQQVKVNPQTAELGVELFYYILSMLSEETISYLPTKVLFSSCIEKLGQSHICGVEYEMNRLLEWILKEPNLGPYLAPHFSPINIGSSNMLQMYSTISKEICKKYDTSFALLSKFEIDKWLITKNPKLSERSQFIELCIKALSALGNDPPVEALMLHGLYRKHLITVFEFQFPEHYGEVLMHLLKASNGSAENNLMSKTVWIDILNSLAQPSTIHLKAPLREQLRQYAQYQKVLHHQEFLETANLLAQHFTHERFKYGLYGLYPKCRDYVDVYALLLGMVGHGLIISTLNAHEGLLGDKLCEKIWPYLRELFAPWLIPYSMQNLKENMAAWIQQLADDRSVLLPWITSDVNFAQKIINVFCECISFIINTLPTATNILSYLWQWYVSSFAHTSVKEHVLTSIHQAFVSFPWHNFWPSLVDLEFMLRVVDQYLPDCHSFLGHIFISVSWVNWTNNFNVAPTEIKVRIYHCFLSLLVKLSNEPNIRTNYADRLKSLMIQAENFEWNVLEPYVFQHVMDWFVMSTDSAIIFKNDPLDLDYRLLHFLRTVSGFNKQWASLTSDMEAKRLIFVKANIKLLSVYISRHRNLINSRGIEIKHVILGYLNNLELVVNSEEEMYKILKELISIVNISDISSIATNTLTEWIQKKTGDSFVVKIFLRCLGASVTDHECLAILYESTIMSYFCNTVSQDTYEEPTWSEVVELINILTPKQSELIQVLISKGSILTLNAILLERVKRKVDKQSLIISGIDWIENMKINESTESKVPLIWFTILQLTLEMCDVDESASATLLHNFSEILLQMSENKGAGKWSRGLLSAIGITKQEAVSLNFRFICKALAGYLLAQLPDMKGKPQIIRRVENAPARVGQTGGNTECAKILLTLDFGQSQGKIKESAQLALNMIQDPVNSLHNARSFLWLLLKQFYIKGYLRDVS